jgi:hypothetical protein
MQPSRLSDALLHLGRNRFLATEVSENTEIKPKI